MRVKEVGGTRLPGQKGTITEVLRVIFFDDRRKVPSVPCQAFAIFLIEKVRVCSCSRRDRGMGLYVVIERRSPPSLCADDQKIGQEPNGGSNCSVELLNCRGATNSTSPHGKR